MYANLPERYREEQVFIREILFDPTELAARLIYADWLDERQDARARLLRIDVELQQLPREASEYPILLKERAQLLPKLDRAWVELLAWGPIERCPASTRQRESTQSTNGAGSAIVEFQFRCPKQWENLKPAEDNASARFCTECERTVHYCHDIESARKHTQKGDCVALDPSVPRKPYDLDYMPETDLQILMGMTSIEEFDPG